MALLDSYKRWSMPVRETEYLELETVGVTIGDEEALLELVDAISAARQTTARTVDPLSDDETADATARRSFCALVGDEHADDLNLILTYYATRKTFFADVVRRGAPEALKLDRLGKQAKALQESLTRLDKKLLPLTGLSSEQLGQLRSQLGVLQQEHGSLEKYLPDLDGALADALIEWWQNVVKQDAKFWSIKDPGSGEASASDFLRFVSAVLSALPSHLHPTETRGSPGFKRNAMRRRHKSLTEEKPKYANFVAWLSSRLTGPTRGD